MEHMPDLSPYFCYPILSMLFGELWDYTQPNTLSPLRSNIFFRPPNSHRCDSYYFVIIGYYSA